jgi:hypothetical protein
MSGYTFCACRDCPYIVMSSDMGKPELCSECKDADCTKQLDLLDKHVDCQREDAYDE